MAVPKRKVTRSRRNMRRAHDAIVLSTPFFNDPLTGMPRLRHHIDVKHLAYRGKEVLRPLALRRQKTA